MFLADCALQHSCISQDSLSVDPATGGKRQEAAAPGGEDGQRSRGTKNQQTVFIALLRLELNPCCSSHGHQVGRKQDWMSHNLWGCTPAHCTINVNDCAPLQRCNFAENQVGLVPSLRDCDPSLCPSKSALLAPAVTRCDRDSHRSCHQTVSCPCQRYSQQTNSRPNQAPDITASC